MNHEVIDNEQILPLAGNVSLYVTTVLVCQNSLVRGGISHILAGTRFVISEEILGDASEQPTLCLIHIDQVTDELTKTVERLKLQWPSARAVLLTDQLESAAIVSAFQAGLDGLCSTAMSGEALIKALELITLGETFISAAAGIALFERRRAAPQAHGAGSGAPVSNNDFASVSTLSGREAQILHLLTKGASNKLIARDLGVAEATVKVHLKAILRKVNAANRTQAAMWAQQHMNRVANDALIAAE
jgi:two-component system nitrate/nitrite response regulator NarL